MRRALLVAAFLAHAGFALRAQEAPLAGFDDYAEAARLAWRVPGLSIAVVHRDRVVLARGYGVRTDGSDEPVGAETLFAIASNTKAFTATALSMLVAEGHLAWDDAVVDRMPEFRLHDQEAGLRMKVSDLLCHRSGLGTWAGDLVWFGSDLTRDEVLRRIRFVPPSYDFGTGYGYTNLMFVVAGELIPRVTGQSWEGFLQERIFDPLGMVRTNTSVARLAGDPDVATPHTLVRGPLEAIPYLDVSNSGPAGAINSCAADMARWLRFQLGEGRFDGAQLVRPEVVEALREPHNFQRLSKRARELNPYTHFSAYGLGFGLADYRGRLLVQHTGGLNGMYSIVALLPEEELGVAILTNLDEHSLTHALVRRVLDAYLEAPFHDWSATLLAAQQSVAPENAAAQRRGVRERRSGTQPSRPLAEYAGTYLDTLYGEARVIFEDGRLLLRLEHHPFTGVLSHWHDDVFLATWDDATWHESAVAFDFDVEGRLVALSLKIRPEWIDPLLYRFERR